MSKNLTIIFSEADKLLARQRILRIIGMTDSNVKLVNSLNDPISELKKLIK